MTPQTMENDFGGTPEQTLDRLKYYATRHGAAITQLTDSMQDVRVRLQSLEDDRNRRNISDARQEERDLALQNELKYLKEAVQGLKGILNKAVAIISGAVLLALVNWALSGKLVAKAAMAMVNQ